MFILVTIWFINPSFVDCALDLVSKKPLPGSKTFILCPMFSSMSFMVLHFIFWSVIPSESTLTRHGKPVLSTFFSLVRTRMLSCLKCSLLKRLSSHAFLFYLFIFVVYLVKPSPPTSKEVEDSYNSHLVTQEEMNSMTHMLFWSTHWVTAPTSAAWVKVQVLFTHLHSQSKEVGRGCGYHLLLPLERPWAWCEDPGRWQTQVSCALHIVTSGKHWASSLHARQCHKIGEGLSQVSEAPLAQAPLGMGSPRRHPLHTFHPRNTHHAHTTTTVLSPHHLGFIAVLCLC